MAGNSSEHGRSVTSKLATILMTFTDGQPRTLSEVAKLSGLPVSTAHRLIIELSSWGLLERADDLYYVGESLCGLGPRARRVPNLQEQARRVMNDLSLATASTVRFGVLQDGRVSYIEKQPRRPVTTFGESASVPAHATAMGIALLAFSPPASVDDIIACGLPTYTPYTVDSVGALRHAMAQTKLSHIAVVRSGLEMGLSAVAVPVLAPGAAVAAALEILVPGLSIDIPRLRAPLMVAARALSRDLACAPRNSTQPQLGGQWLPAKLITDRPVDARVH